MKIAVLNRHFSTTGGGAERYSIALVEQLSSRHDIHVFAQHIDHQWPGVTYHRIPQLLKRPRWFNQLWFAAVSWWATRKGFDVVHSHENTWHGQVQTVHVLPVKYNLFHGRTGWTLALRCLKVLTSLRLLVYLELERGRFSMATPRAIVVTSNTLIAQTMEAYPQCRSAIVMVTPGVDRVTGPSSQRDRSASRQRLGLPEEGWCVLLVANDYRKKGLIALIAAMHRLPDEIYLAVVGNAAHIPEFKLMCDTAGLGRRVHFLGSRRDMDEVYSAADCLAHPTLEDTFAMVVLEAMAHGLPVVVSNVRHCGIAGLLTHETNALILADPTDADALAVALNRLADDPAFRQCLIRAGVGFASQHLWETLARQQESIYLKSLQR